MNSGRGERKVNLLPAWRDLRQQHDALMIPSINRLSSGQEADPVGGKWFS